MSVQTILATLGGLIFVGYFMFVVCGFRHINLCSRRSIYGHCLVLHTERRLATRKGWRRFVDCGTECLLIACCCVISFIGCSSSPLSVDAALDYTSRRSRAAKLRHVLEECLGQKDMVTTKAVLSLPLGEIALRDFAGLTEAENAATASWSPASLLVFKQRYDAAATVLSMPDHRRDE